jgi:hypothetical protein
MYEYSIVFEHEKKEHCRKFETNGFEAAEKMFWSMVLVARETLDNYSVTWIRTATKEKGETILLNLVKTFD